MKLPEGFKSMPVKDNPNELYIKISRTDGALVDLLNQEIEEMQKDLLNQEMEELQKEEDK